MNLECDIKVYFEDRGAILSVEPLSMREDDYPTQVRFPFADYNTPAEMGRSIVVKLDELAINELKTIVPDGIKEAILNIFVEEFDIVEEMILYNKPATRLH